MIVVTGGTGRVGTQVVAQLRERDLPVRVVSRTAGRTPAGVETAGVEAVSADLADPASLEPHLRGADSLFLLWPFTSAEVTAALAPRVAKIRRPPRHAGRVPVRAARGGRPGSFWALAERAIEDSGVRWTFLRPTGFASNTLMWADQIRSGDVVRWPFGSAARSLIDERDIAAVAVQALTQDGHAGSRYLLSGPALLTQAEQLAAIGRALGRDLIWEELPPAGGPAGAGRGLGRPRVRRVRPRYLGAVRDPPGDRHLHRPRNHRRPGAQLRRLGRGQRRRLPLSSAPGVVAGAVPVDHDHRLVADYPGVVALGQGGDVAGPRIELRAVGHDHVQHALHVVLEVRRLAQVGARERLDVLGPAPARLQGQPPISAPPIRSRSSVPRSNSRVSSEVAKLFCSALAVMEYLLYLVARTWWPSRSGRA